MYTFKELRKADKLTVSGKEIRIAVLGNCATQFFSKAICGYGKLEGLNIAVYDADYNQMDAQLLDSGSEVYQFQADNIILWLATEKLYEEFLDLPMNERKYFADSYIKRLENYWKLIEKNCKSRIIQPNLIEIDDKSLGQFSCKIDSTFVFQIRKLNCLLQEAMSKNNRVYPVDFLSIQIQLGRNQFFDAPLYYNTKMTVSTFALPYVAKAVIDILKAMTGKMKKCVVLDLDNTLWGGVIGDDGIDHIEIGELGKGHVFTNFQRWLKQLKECGIILAVCSKNNEEIAKEPFEKHQEMILRLSDISVFVANWEDKASNIRMIQESLNIGMDSMVFIDDNPFERNLIREMLPDVAVPELPEDPALYLGYLQGCNYFEAVSYVGAEGDRTSQYQAEMKRKKMEQSFSNIKDYLKSLEMIGESKPFEPSRFSRIAQLTQRSNQFNLRTARYTEDEIERIANDEQYLTLYFTLKDKYGDHGLVAVLIMKKKSNTEIFIDTWLMSCRVLKRGMEEFIVNTMIQTAREAGFIKISAEYIPTAKNKMVKDIYSEMGFNEVRENQYVLTLDDYIPKDTYIKRMNGENNA